MERMLETLDVAIPKGRTMRVRNAKGTTLRMLEGTGWITEESNTEDYTLGAHESRCVGTDGLTLVHAFEDARLALEAPASTGAATVELGGGYREYAAAVWGEQVADAGRR
ncbi:MAG: DUF2917 domain-containing protein, partial [Burkholderiales bacterium]|nr:DUF2917 domain-containing protein [Burkholderiales bacterium]